MIRTLRREERSVGLYVLEQELSLFNEQITRDNVDAFIQRIQRRCNGAGPKDVVLVYLSGHGKVIDGQYYYIPPMTIYRNDEVKQKAINWSQLEKLETTRCHVIWMVDTCDSGMLVELQSIRTAAEARSFVLSAASGTDETFAGEVYKDNEGNSHSAFTAALLKGLDGEADGVTPYRAGPVGQRDGIVTIGELVEYVKQTVYRATGRNQRPNFGPTDLLEVIDLPLARVKEPETGSSNPANQ